jgi:predicted transposase/invertase (TIGR01784 family)
MERGLQQGMERGLQQGMEQGIIQKAKTMAKKMLLKHRPIEEIADFTELSIDDIRQLEKEEIINA